MAAASDQRYPLARGGVVDHYLHKCTLGRDDSRGGLTLLSLKPQLRCYVHGCPRGVGKSPACFRRWRQGLDPAIGRSRHSLLGFVGSPRMWISRGSGKHLKAASLMRMEFLPTTSKPVLVPAHINGSKTLTNSVQQLRNMPEQTRGPPAAPPGCIFQSCCASADFRRGAAP